MLMVNCDKCGKPIDHTHNFEITTVGDGLTEETALKSVVRHINCEDPTYEYELLRSLKSGPVFETLTPNQRQILQNAIYKKS